MSLQYLVSAVSSFIVATSIRIPDFSEIEIRLGELVPAQVEVLEGSTVKEFGYNFEIVDGIYE